MTARDREALQWLTKFLAANPQIIDGVYPQRYASDPPMSQLAMDVANWQFFSGYDHSLPSNWTHELRGGKFKGAEAFRCFGPGSVPTKYGEPPDTIDESLIKHLRYYVFEDVNGKIHSDLGVIVLETHDGEFAMGEIADCWDDDS